MSRFRRPTQEQAHALSGLSLAWATINKFFKGGVLNVTPTTVVGQFPGSTTAYGAAGYPVDVAATEADGAADLAARSDHQHAHGSGYLADAHHNKAHDHTTGDGTGVLTNDEHDGYSLFTEISTPSTPASTKLKLYVKAKGGISTLYYMKDDGTEIEVSSSGGGLCTVHAPSAAAVWTNQPAALTELLGLTVNRSKVDLTYAKTVRLVAEVDTAGVAGAKLRGQYSTDGGSTWHYMDGATGPELAIDATGVITSSIVTLEAGANADVLIRVIGINGDGAADPALGLIQFQFDAVTGVATTPFTPYDSIIAGMSGLVHRWKFEEASGNFVDSVGSLTLTASGSWVYSVAGGPVSGAAGSCQVGAGSKGVSSGAGSIPVGANARSFVLVFKGPDNTAKQSLFSYGTSGATRQWWNAFLNDTATLAFGAKPPAMGIATWADDFNVGSVPAMYATWHLLVITFDGNRGLSLFIDGVLFARALGGAVNTGSTNFQIAQTSGGSDQLQGGVYDDLAVFNRCLQAYEIQRLWSALCGALP